jgi:hypothetical protein
MVPQAVEERMNLDMEAAARNIRLSEVMPCPVSCLHCMQQLLWLCRVLPCLCLRLQLKCLMNVVLPTCCMLLLLAALHMYAGAHNTWYRRYVPAQSPFMATYC